MDLNPNNKYSNISDTNSPGGNLQTTIALTLSEVAKHSKAGNCWMVFNNKVYDLSDYVGHPGGSNYLIYCGTEATNAYNTEGGRGRSHSSYADLLLSNYLIGEIGTEVIMTDINAPLNTGAQIPTNNANHEDYDDD